MSCSVPRPPCGDTMIGTTSGPAADFIVGFEMVSLNEKFKTLLDGRVTWGPVGAGDLCLFETDDSMLRAISADGNTEVRSEVACWTAGRRTDPRGKFDRTKRRDRLDCCN